MGFPRLYAAASLKRPLPAVELLLCARFPRLYAAASLKQVYREAGVVLAPRFSAALCRGLIEAERCRERQRRGLCVFRGFMPRPH